MKIKTLLLATVLVPAAGPAGAADAEDVGTAGDVLQLALPLTALGAAYAANEPQWRGQLYGSLGTTLIVAHILKFAIDEKRPGSDAENSFPSGHTAAAFAGAGLLDRRYGHSLGIPAYALASFVGYSRLETDAHHPRDVVAGAALAIGTNYLVTSLRPGVEVRTTIGERSTGIQVAIAF